MAEGRRYLFAGGGTGGHVIPNLAMIRELGDQEPSSRFLYVGSGRGPERGLVAKREIPFRAVPARALASPRHPIRFALFALAFFAGLVKSIWILLRFRPHVVVATGGYVSAGPVLAAALLRRPVFLHEQNVKPGKANLFLSRFAARVGVSFEETLKYFPAEKAVVTGYPVRRRIAAGDQRAARQRLRIGDDQRVAFILGGSMGARSINRATVEGLERLLSNDKVTVIHSTGLTESSGYDAWKDTVARLKSADVPEDFKQRYILRRFFDQIEDAYAASDLVVARAGAGVVMELSTLGKPALLIPKSDGADDHQLVNALSLKDRGSADVMFEEMYEERDRTITRVHGDQLARKINDLLGDDGRLEEMSRSARSVAIPEAGPNNTAIVRRLASEDRDARHRSMQLLVGSLTDAEGAETELFFPVTTLGSRSSADVRLRIVGRDRAVIRRFGRRREETTYELVPRAGRVRVDGEPVTKRTRLSPGQVIEIGENRLVFNARVQVTQLSTSRGSFLGKVVVTGFGTLLSRMTGLIRQVALAAAFATSGVVDVFAASLTAANLFRRVFAENAVDSAFLPTFTLLREGGRPVEAARLFRTLLTVSIVATAGVVIVGVLSAPLWVEWLVPGFREKGLLGDTIHLTRVMLPYLALITIAAILAAALKALNRFAVPAYSSVMFNVGILAGIVLYTRMGLTGLGVGLLLGGVGQVLLNLLPFASRTFRQRSGLGFRPLLELDSAGMRKVRGAAPKIVADVTIAKMSTVVDVMIVSTLAEGLVSVLFYALLLFQLPFALISQSINTVALKEFSHSIAARDDEACRRLVTGGITWSVFLLLPASLFLIILSKPIVALLLQYGQFGVGQTEMVAIALSAYGIGLVGWGLQSLMGRFYASRLEVGQAALINLGAVILNIALSLTFVAMGWSFAGVALGTSVAFLANGFFRIWHFNRKMLEEGSGFSLSDIAPSLRRSGLASIAAALVCFLMLRAVHGFDALPEVLSRFLVVALPALAGVVAYAGAALALRSPEMDDLTARLRRQLPRVPQPRTSRGPLNVYCLRPEQLLRTAVTHPETVRGANLTRRVRELLQKSLWKQRNIGVKLVGRLKIRSLKYDLVKIITDRTPAPRLQRLFGADFVNPGFVRRNAVGALVELEALDEDVEGALLDALVDPYFEVRSAAARGIAACSRELTPPARREAIVRLARLCAERNFEVAMSAVQGLEAAALDDSVLPTLERLHYHQNWQVRHAVVKAYYGLYRRGVVEDRKLILDHLDDVLITCDSFRPSFELKETMRVVRVGLSDADDDASREATR